MGEPTWQERESATPVSPRDCALCLGMPLSREAVQRCLAAPEEPSYIAGIMKGRAITEDTIDALWPEYQAQVLVPVKALSDRLAELGVDVRQVARPENLIRPDKEQRVYLLWSHWEAPSFRGEEITDPDALMRHTESGTSWVHREVREALKPRRWFFWRADATKRFARLRAEGRLREYVASALNRSIAQARRARDDGLEQAMREPNPVRSRPVRRAATSLLTRALVEKWFPDAVTAGECLELADGMVTVRDFLKELPLDRWLVLDMTVCNSTELAEVGRLSHPRIRMIAPYHKADRVSGALLVLRTMQLLAKQPRPYLEARALAMSQLREEMENAYELGEKSA